VVWGYTLSPWVENVIRVREIKIAKKEINRVTGMVTVPSAS
jgi:hypothetical protein